MQQTDILSMNRTEKIAGGIFFALYLFVLPFAANPLFSTLSDLWDIAIPDNICSMILYYILFACTLLIFRDSLATETARFLSHRWHTLYSAALGLTAYYVLSTLSHYALEHTLSGIVNLNDLTFSTQIHSAPHSTALIVIFLAPFIEESLFRGYVFGNLRERSRCAAYVLSCLLFAFLHIWQFALTNQNPSYLLLTLQYLVPGLVLAWTYEYSGTLWGNILLHTGINALSVWACLSPYLTAKEPLC